MNLITFVDKNENLNNCFVCVKCRKNTKNIALILYEEKLVISILLCAYCINNQDYDMYDHISTKFFKKYTQKCNAIIRNDLYVHDKDMSDTNNRLIDYDITKLLS